MSGEEEDLTTLSLKGLKDLISRAGLSSADCIDKADLRARAAQAQERLKASAPKTKPAGSGGSLDRINRKFGPYDCIVLGPADVLRGSATADLCVVILHGLGATSSDFADLPSILGVDAALANRRILYVFPQAPAVPMLGYAWWQIDVMSFLSLQSAAPDAIATLIRKPPAGLDSCRASLAVMMREVRGFAAATSGKPLHFKKLLLGGFSQGAMTSMDAALQVQSQEMKRGHEIKQGYRIDIPMTR
jgi:predicted esterase